MKKIKITHNGFKRCSLLFLPMVLLVATVLTPFVPTQKTQAATPAETYCGSVKWSSKNKAEKLAQCKIGYQTAYDGKNVNWEEVCKDKPKADVFERAIIEACHQGFFQGAWEFIANNPQTFDQAKIDGLAEDFCVTQNGIGSSGIEFDACVDGYSVAAQGKEVDWRKTCNPSTHFAFPKCTIGFYQGARDFIKGSDQRIREQNKALEAMCKTLPGIGGNSEVVACRKGYRGVLDGKTVEAVCGSIKDKGVKTACEAGHTEALKDCQVDATDACKTAQKKLTEDLAKIDSTPKETADCESATSSGMSWILCLLIEGASEANDTIFSMIQPLLKNVPVGNSPEDSGYIAWQSFRVLGNVFLVGCLLAIVFAQVRTPK